MWSLISTLNKLRSGDPATRKAGVEAAGALPQKMMAKAIVRAFADPKNDVKMAAIVALSSTKNEHAVPLLLRALKDKSSSVRLGAANALGVRASAIDAERGAAYEALSAAFTDETDAQTALAMAMSMRNTTDPRAVDALIKAVQDRYVQQSVAAATALMTLHEPKVFDALAAALEKTDAGDLINSASKALASFNDIRAVGLILTKLRNLKQVYVWKDHTPFYYENPLSAMMPVFLDALVAIQHPEKAAALMQALHDGDQPVRVVAALALGQTGDAGAEHSLLKLTEETDPGVRAAAEEGLKTLRKALY